MGIFSSDMSYDWVEQKMYFVNKKKGLITAISTQRPQQGTDELYKDIVSPTEVVVEPHTK